MTRSQNRRAENPGQRFRAATMLFAMALHQRGELADARGQNGFDPFANPARQDRRCAAGADRDHDIAAIDDGGKDEGRKVRAVDHIHRNAERPGARREPRRRSRRPRRSPARARRRYPSLRGSPIITPMWPA